LPVHEVRRSDVKYSALAAAFSASMRARSASAWAVEKVPSCSTCLTFSSCSRSSADTCCNCRSATAWDGSLVNPASSHEAEASPRKLGLRTKPIGSFQHRTDLSDTLVCPPRFFFQYCTFHWSNETPCLRKRKTPDQELEKEKTGRHSHRLP
jgi:hypothetical protein